MAHFHLLASRQDKVGESFKHKKIIIFMINCVIFELFNHPKVFLFIIISILPPGERPPRGRLSPEPALPHNHLCNRLHPSYRPILPGQYQESRQPPSSKMIFVLIPAIIIVIITPFFQGFQSARYSYSYATGASNSSYKYPSCSTPPTPQLSRPDVTSLLFQRLEECRFSHQATLQT
jgi:hypothetical protein